ncbi:MAG: hypothetical protein LPK14_08240, partial [Hymenobacteraceae bacterium]|nr:hypothetical protein [Hymenobacteraceae bacterium]
MRHLYMVFIVLSGFSFTGCNNPESQRGDEDAEAAENAVVQDSKREITPADIVVPSGFSIEAVATGLTYPVDVTFDEQGNTYIAEAGGHTYGTKPARAPEARILQLLPDGT